MKKISIAEALRDQMIDSGAKKAWAGDPDLLLSAYARTNGKIEHPLNRIKAVLDSARRSKLFIQSGYIRACDVNGRREIRHPCFKLTGHITEE